MLLAILKWDFNNTTHDIMRTLLMIFFPSSITLSHYTPHHGPHLALNPVPHQGRIYSRDFYHPLPDTTDGPIIDGQTQTHEGRELLPMYQGLTQGESYPHALYAQRMVVVSPRQTRTLRHPPGSNCTDYNDIQQHHDLRLHLCQAQAQEAPRYFLPN